VLFRRVRTVLIRPDGNGLIGNTLNFDYEVRSAEEVFDGIPAIKVKGEMLDLAKYIIETKTGTFDPSEYDDRYDAAVAELVKAKLEGRPMKAPAKRPEGKVVDLMEALRKSAQASGNKTQARKRTTSSRKSAASAPKRKAG
jgi:DNA end-binding protein Ku